MDISNCYIVPSITHCRINRHWCRRQRWKPRQRSWCRSCYSSASLPDPTLFPANRIFYLSPMSMPVAMLRLWLGWCCCSSSSSFVRRCVGQQFPVGNTQPLLKARVLWPEMWVVEPRFTVTQLFYVYGCHGNLSRCLSQPVNDVLVSLCCGYCYWWGLRC